MAQAVRYAWHVGTVRGCCATPIGSPRRQDGTSAGSKKRSTPLETFEGPKAREPHIFFVARGEVQGGRPQDFLPFVNPRLSISLPHLHDRLTTDPAHIIAETITEHGHQDAQQTVPNSAQSLAMPMSFGPQSRI